VSNNPSIKIQSTTNQNTQSLTFWLLIALISLIGLGITTYLTSTAFSNTDVGCSISGCNTVLNSKWARLFEIPVSVFGMTIYATTMLGALHAYKSPTDDLRSRRLVVAASMIGVIASVYLTAIEIFVIKAVCQYCLTSGALIIIASIILLIGLKKERTLHNTIVIPTKLGKKSG